AFVGRGNLFAESLARLDALASLIGVEAGTKPEGYANMAAALEAELKNAEVVLADMDWEDKEVPMPGEDHTLAERGRELNKAQRELRDEFNSWDALTVQLERQSIEEGRVIPAAELAQIMKIKAHMESCGELVDMALAGTKAAKGKGLVEGGKAAAANLAPKAAKKAGVPSSGKEMFGEVVEWYYEDEIDALKAELEAIDALLDTQSTIIRALDLRQQHQRFQTKVIGYEGAMR